MVEELFPDYFLKNEHISGSKVLYSLFLLYAKLRAIKIYWNYAADHLLFPHLNKKQINLLSLSTTFFW